MQRHFFGGIFCAEILNLSIYSGIERHFRVKVFSYFVLCG